MRPRLAVVAFVVLTVLTAALVPALAAAHPPENSEGWPPPQQQGTYRPVPLDRWGYPLRRPWAVRRHPRLVRVWPTPPMARNARPPVDRGPAPAPPCPVTPPPPTAEYDDAAEPEPLPPEATDDVLIEAVEREILRLVNVEREREGLAPLLWSATLAAVALRHSHEMATLDFFSHESPTPDNRTLTDRLKRGGLSDFGAAGENIAAAGFALPQAATGFVQMWMDSPGHRRNVMATEYRFLGVGVVRKGGRLYATQNFAARVGVDL